MRAGCGGDRVGWWLGVDDLDADVAADLVAGDALECADLVAGGVQRRVLFKGRNPKDRLAESIENVTGFETAADAGALFKIFP